jgi:hypothetical protein
MFLPRNQSALVAFWLCDRDLRLLLAVPPTCSLIQTLYRKRQTADSEIHCLLKLSDAVSVAGPRSILLEVMSAVPFSVVSFTLPWNVISTDAIGNWF